MTRYRAVQVAALVLAGLAVSQGQIAWVGVVVAALGGVVGLGVAIPQLRFFGPFVCRGEGTRDRAVALTFDDGPDPVSTPALLDLLREAGVPAAFFCIGERVAAHPELAARIAREGHLVENHSYHHSHLTNFFGVGRLCAELKRTQAIIERTTGVAPTCFRPPMGLSNPRVFRAARTVGLRVVGWTARGFDTRAADPARIVERVLRGIAPGGVILLHDGDIAADRLVATVERLLAALRARGYQVARLDRVLPSGWAVGAGSSEGVRSEAITAELTATAVEPLIVPALTSGGAAAQLGGEARRAPQSA
jgi:peptidoglycan/xylan/chitin deacetylase (PgdA/CDA1 family)